MNKNILVDLFKDIVGLEIIDNAARRGKLSQDFNWYSPILIKQLEGKSADIILRPYTQEALVNSMRIIFNNDLELTVRGGGTGNYGQCVPINGGVIIDMSRFAGVLQLSDKEIKVRSGTKIVDVDTYCKEYNNKEIRIFPSTYRSATVGGFFCGGSAGVGSMIYGGLAQMGNVNSITICTLEASPKLVNIKDSELSGIHHAYGTNGIVVDISLPIEVREDWVEQVFTFDKIDKAMDFCEVVGTSFPKKIRLLTLLENPISSYFNNFGKGLENKTFVMLITEKTHSKKITKLIDKHNGDKFFEQDYDNVRVKGKTIIELTWNHTTLHAIKANRSLTYLQASYGQINKYRDRILSLKKRLGSEYIVHLEYMRSKSRLVVGGLPLVEFESEERLYEIIKLHTENDVIISNPHIYTINMSSTTNYNKIVEAKKRFDPHSLMNSQKLTTDNTSLLRF